MGKKVINAELRLRKKEKPSKNPLEPTNWTMTLEHKDQTMHEILKEHLPKDALEFFVRIEIKPKRRMKTTKQLGYLHAEVFQKYYSFYEHQGALSPKEMIRADLKFHPEVWFVHEVYNVLTNETRIEPRSAADATIEECSMFIEKLIRLASGYGINIETPEAYKKRKKITEDEWTKKQLLTW